MDLLWGLFMNDSFIRSMNAHIGKPVDIGKLVILLGNILDEKTVKEWYMSVVIPS